MQSQPRNMSCSIRKTYWRDGRVVECGGLENRCTERYQGFESLSLRKMKTIAKSCSCLFFMMYCLAGALPERSKGMRSEAGTLPFSFIDILQDSCYFTSSRKASGSETPSEDKNGRSRRRFRCRMNFNAFLIRRFYLPVFTTVTAPSSLTWMSM